MAAQTVPTYSPRFWTGAAGATAIVNCPTIPILKAFEDRIRMTNGVGFHGLVLEVTVANGGMAPIDVFNNDIIHAMTVRTVYEQHGVRRVWQVRADNLNLANFGTSTLCGFPLLQWEISTIGAGTSGTVTCVIMHAQVDPLGDGEISLSSIVECGLMGTIPLPAGLTLTDWTVQAVTFERPRDPTKVYLDVFRLPFEQTAVRSPDVIGGGVVETLALVDGAGLDGLTLSSLRRGESVVAENTMTNLHSAGLDMVYDDGVSLTDAWQNAPTGAAPTNQPVWLLRDARSSLGDTPMGDISLALSAGVNWPTGTLYTGIIRAAKTDAEQGSHQRVTAAKGQKSYVASLTGKRPIATVPPNILKYVPQRSSFVGAGTATKAASALTKR